MTNAKLVKPAGVGHEISAREAWKLFGIMAEFFEATERLAGIRKVMFARFASAYVVLPGGYGTLVVDAIFNFYEKRGFEPSPAEREVLLNL